MGLPQALAPILGALVIAATILACVRRVDVRLALLLGALALGVVAGQPAAILQTFLKTFSDEKFVVPICTAMGFAHVLRLTQCDQHLVQLLVGPLRRVRSLLVPGAVLVGFLVNIPVISQTSTAITIGFVLIPLFRASRISPVTTGAALLLGSSLGGELINPGAPEFGTVASITGRTPDAIVARILPLVLVQLAIAGASFWFLSLWADARRPAKGPVDGEEDDSLPPAGERASSLCPLPSAERGPYQSPLASGERGRGEGTDTADTLPPFKVNLLKALVPLVPFLILFVVGPPLRWLAVPEAWLVNPAVPADHAHFSSRLVGAAMLVGVAVAALMSRPTFGATARVFFEGAGYAFTHIIALIVTASCFGKGVELIGVAALFGRLIDALPSLLLPTAGFVPLAFAVLCGSGMASTQSLFPFFAGPAQALGIDPTLAGAVVSVGSAAGRTMSPVAAVTLMCASLTGTNPLALARRVAGPLLLGMAAVVIAAALIAAGK